MNQDIITTNKSLIILKSSVIAMGIVFVVLLVAFVFIKQKNPSKKIDSCQKFLHLEVSGEIDKMELQGSNIIIVTKINPKTKKQEIIKIDNSCTQVINRIELQIK